MSINYEYYRIFYYVAKYQNFTQAAAALMNNQPNITRTIKNLENELGCTLFLRSNRGVILTPEGEKLLKYVKIAVEQIEMGEEQIFMDRNLQKGTISIGASEVALRCFLLPILKEYRALYPGVRLRILNQPTPRPIAALRDGAVDIAFVTTPTGETKRLETKILKEYREAAVCGEAFLALTKREVSLEELSGYPMISLDIRAKSHDFYGEWFAKNGLTFSNDIEVATADQILPVVRNNLGIGFVPEDFLEEENSAKIYRLRLKEEMPARYVCYVKRPDQPLGVAAKELERMILERVR